MPLGYATPPSSMARSARRKSTRRTAEIDAAGLAELIARGGQEAALVAVGNGEIVGTCLLVADELDAQHDVSPWLAGLVVSPAHRRNGIGAALVRAIERTAGERGFIDLHLYTFGSESFYGGLGWEQIDRFEDGYGPSILMRRMI
ncbi:MAG: GNAT family N-acetyltransferase [Mesorhizobium sp.]